MAGERELALRKVGREQENGGTTATEEVQSVCTGWCKSYRENHSHKEWDKLAGTAEEKSMTLDALKLHPAPENKYTTAPVTDNSKMLLDSSLVETPGSSKSRGDLPSVMVPYLYGW